MNNKKQQETFFDWFVQALIESFIDLFVEW